MTTNDEPASAVANLTAGSFAGAAAAPDPEAEVELLSRREQCF